MYYIISELIRRNIAWLGLPNMSLKHKLGLYLSVLFVFFKRKVLLYWGQSFKYDNRVIPLSLITYPVEINRVFAGISQQKIKSVLDIGANLGQFSVTAFNILKPDRMDLFEPNSEILELLEHNLKYYNNTHLYNLGIGKPGRAELLYSEGKSATGYLNPSNNNRTQCDNLRSSAVQLVDDVEKITGHAYYDLIKLDVEGYEFEVLENIKVKTPRYLYIELSGEARQHDYRLSELYLFLRHKFGDFEILYSDQITSKTIAFNQLLAFAPQKD